MSLSSAYAIDLDPPSRKGEGAFKSTVVLDRFIEAHMSRYYEGEKQPHQTKFLFDAYQSGRYARGGYWVSDHLRLRHMSKSPDITLPQSLPVQTTPFRTLHN